MSPLVCIDPPSDAARTDVRRPTPLGCARVPPAVWNIAATDALVYGACVSLRRVPSCRSVRNGDLSMLPSTVSDQTSAQPLASTGIEGLDHVLGGGLTANRVYLVEGMPGSGKTTLAFQFLREGVQPRRAHPVHSAVGNRRRNPGRRRLAWLVAGRHLPARARAHGRQPAARRAVHDVPPLRGRAHRGDQADSRRRRRVEAGASRVGLALRVSAAGGEPAALPAANACTQAVLCRPATARCCCSTTSR